MCSSQCVCVCMHAYLRSCVCVCVCVCVFVCPFAEVFDITLYKSTTFSDQESCLNGKLA